MSVLARAALLATLVGALVPASAEGQAGRGDSLIRRVESLESRSADLERRVRELESVFNAQRLRGQQTAAKSSSPTLQKWRQLKTGMNPDAVRALLGEPERVNGGTVASWSYPNGGRVGFISDALSQWSEPNSFPSDQ